MPLTQELIAQAMEIYPATRAELERLAVRTREICEAIAQDAAIRARAQHRVKSPASLERKLLREFEQDPQDRSPRFESATSGLQVLQAVRDLVGVRVVPYREADREILADLICEAFDGPIGPDSRPERRADGQISPNPNYRAVHCQVRLSAEQTPAAQFACEIQVVGALAHVWNELEHDIGYKRADPTARLSDAEAIALDGLADLTRAGDHVVELLLAANERSSSSVGRIEPSTAPFRDSVDLVYAMRDRFPTAKNFARGSQELFEQLVSLGLDSEAAVEATLLADPEFERLARRIIAETNRDAQPGEPLMDETTSDLLLALVLEYAATDLTAARKPGRPSRAQAFAVRRERRSRPGVPPAIPARTPPDHRPAWVLIKECAESLGAGGASFTLREINACVQKKDPSRRSSSLAPIVQGMTRNAPGGVPSAGGGSLLFRVSRGLYELYDSTRHKDESQPPLSD